MLRILVTSIMLGLMSGCSVGMALHGTDTPYLGVVKQNASRGEVELQLGGPVSVITLDNGHVLNMYEYEVGNDPSAIRAMGHAAMDFFTLGVWEIIGTPIEGFQGDRYRIQIEYDENDRIVNVTGNIPLKSNKL